MNAFFQYPPAAAFGRALPKTKIYEHARISTKLKQLLVDQVDKIVWQYKLATETTNLPATRAVPEIQIFSVTLKSGEIDETVLAAIDKAIRSPLIFELLHGGKRRALATFKRPNAADPSKWVISEYFGTGWVLEGAERLPLPVALSLESLYEKILAPMLPAPASTDETLTSRVERLERIRATERELAAIKGRLSREKQYNKRVAINAELRDAKQRLKELVPAKVAGR